MLVVYRHVVLCRLVPVRHVLFFYPNFARPIVQSAFFYPKKNIVWCPFAPKSDIFIHIALWHLVQNRLNLSKIDSGIYQYIPGSLYEDYAASSLTIMFKTAATKIAHNSTLPALGGNQDLRPLQDLITAEKAVLISCVYICLGSFASNVRLVQTAETQCRLLKSLGSPADMGTE